MGTVRMRVQTADKNITIIHPVWIKGEYTQIKHHLQAKTILNKNVDGFLMKEDNWDFFHYRKRYYRLYFGKKQWFKVKTS